MTWFIAVYFVVFIGLSVAGLVEDCAARRPRWYQGAMVVTFLVGVLSISAFAYPTLAQTVGAWLWVLLLYAVSMETSSVVWDVRDMAAEGKLSRWLIVAITVGVALLTFPAYLLGLLAATRAGG